jgi:hypothetical protein
MCGRSDRGGRSPGRGGVRVEPRCQHRLRLRLYRACQQRVGSARRAGDAALMAGEKGTVRIVWKVFSESLDVVVHLDRDDVVSVDADAIREHVMEIAALVPALRADFTIEPIFVRDGIGAPLRWTGACPAGSRTVSNACCEPDRLKNARLRVVDRRKPHAVGLGVVVLRQRLARVAGSRDPGRSPREHRRRGMSNRLCLSGSAVVSRYKRIVDRARGRCAETERCHDQQEHSFHDSLPPGRFGQCCPVRRLPSCEGRPHPQPRCRRARSARQRVVGSFQCQFRHLWSSRMLSSSGVMPRLLRAPPTTPMDSLARSRSRRTPDSRVREAARGRAYRHVRPVAGDHVPVWRCCRVIVVAVPPDRLSSRAEGRLPSVGARRITALVTHDLSGAEDFWSAVRYGADPRRGESRSFRRRCLHRRGAECA